MIKHIKISNLKGLKSQTLNDLGIINVFCGKNNSGKTTILEAISLPNNNFEGVNVDHFIHDKVMNAFREEAKRYNQQTFDELILWFDSCLEEMKYNNPIWYYDEITRMHEKIVSSSNVDRFSKNSLVNIDFNYVLRSAFTKNFNKGTSIIIPPKRNFESTSTINLDESLTPHGDGLVNRIFFLKNHRPKSTEFEMYQKIHAEFKRITNYSFNVIPTNDNKLNLNFYLDQREMYADDCGLGLKDVLLIITFIYCTDYEVYLIEEPENHLHADFQKKILNFFKSIENKQFFISTHSNIFLNSDRVDKIFFCWHDEHIQISDKTSMSKMVESLGHSITENLTSDAIILTEGPTDIPIIKKALQLNGALDLLNIKFWPLGGDIMGSLDLSIFANVKDIFAIIDKDPGSVKIRNIFKKNCKANGIECIQLSRYSIENYLTLSSIKEAFPGKIDKALDTLDNNESVDKQIGFKSKGKSIKGKNHIMSQKLTIKDLEGTDLWSFAAQIKKKLEDE